MTGRAAPQRLRRRPRRESHVRIARTSARPSLAMSFSSRPAGALKTRRGFRPGADAHNSYCVPELAAVNQTSSPPGVHADPRTPSHVGEIVSWCPVRSTTTTVSRSVALDRPRQEGDAIARRRDARIPDRALGVTPARGRSETRDAAQSRRRGPRRRCRPRRSSRRGDMLEQRAAVRRRAAAPARVWPRRRGAVAGG